MVFASHNPNELLMGANVLFQTLDDGTHWKAISPDLTRNDKSKEARPGGPISADVTGEEMFGTISSIAFSPLTDNVMWTGSDDGLVYVTTNGGGHWTQVRPPTLPEWSTITCIEPSHIDAGTAYLSASRYDWDDFHPYVYKTTDYGKHWTEITTGLSQGEYVESVRQDPNQPNLLFAGTSATAYFSLDGGELRSPLTLNLPAVRVNDVEIQPSSMPFMLLRDCRTTCSSSSRWNEPFKVHSLFKPQGLAGDAPWGRVRGRRHRREPGARRYGVLPPAGGLRRQHAGDAHFSTESGKLIRRLSARTPAPRDQSVARRAAEAAGVGPGTEPLPVGSRDTKRGGREGHLQFRLLAEPAHRSGSRAGYLQHKTP